MKLKKYSVCVYIYIYTGVYCIYISKMNFYKEMFAASGTFVLVC